MLQAALSDYLFLNLLPFSQNGFVAPTRDVAGAVIAEQTQLVAHDGLAATRGSQRQSNSICHVFSPHVCAKLPSNGVAAVIIQNGAEIVPSALNNVGVPPTRRSRRILIPSGKAAQ